MLMEEDEITFRNPASEEIRTSADVFTPTARGSSMEKRSNRRPLIEELGSDDEERPARSLLEDVDSLLRRRPTPMKPGRFDGTGSFESFLVQFEVCASHNKWTAADKVDHLRCALERAATQLLWDFGAQPNATYEELVERLRQRYGTEGQA